MSFEKGTLIPDNPSFEIILDHACERLWEKKIQISLRKLGELENVLQGLEQELDAFLLREKGR
jgi:hypothetical protein